ncbi:hypothetical protein ACXHQO_23545, partial [Vibrio antiquarius]
TLLTSWYSEEQVRPTLKSQSIPLDYFRAREMASRCECIEGRVSYSLKPEYTHASNLFSLNQL